MNTPICFGFFFTLLSVIYLRNVFELDRVGLLSFQTGNETVLQHWKVPCEYSLADLKARDPHQGFVWWILGMDIWEPDPVKTHGGEVSCSDPAENQLFLNSCDIVSLCNSLAPGLRTFHFLAATAGGTQEIKHPLASKHPWCSQRMPFPLNSP